MKLKEKLIYSLTFISFLVTTTGVWSIIMNPGEIYTCIITLVGIIGTACSIIEMEKLTNPTINENKKFKNLTKEEKEIILEEANELAKEKDINKENKKVNDLKTLKQELIELKEELESTKDHVDNIITKHLIKRK